MYPPEFDYRRAASVDEALDLLATDADARVLAGGHALLPEMKTGETDPELLVDVGDVEALDGIDVGESETTVGASTTYAELVDADALWTHAPVIADAAAALGDRQVRNRGTLGGKLAQADPDADLPAAVVAADATILVRGPDGRRTVPVSEFFRGDGETAVGDAELLTAVEIPHDGPGDGSDNGSGDNSGQGPDDGSGRRGGAYVKKAHPATGYAMVGVAAVLETDGGEVSGARVAANGVQQCAVELPAVEDELVGGPATEDAVRRAAGRAREDLDLDAVPSDPYASGEFRANLLETYAERALTRALRRAEGDDPTGGVRR